MSASHGGKGDTPRPVDPKVYGENFERIFRKSRTVRIPVENHLGEIIAYAECEERFLSSETTEYRQTLQAIRDAAFNCKWPKPRFDWENKK